MIPTKKLICRYLSISRYKLAEFFEDEEAKKRILSANSSHDAEEAMKTVKGFNENDWNKVSW